MPQRPPLARLFSALCEGGDSLRTAEWGRPRSGGARGGLFLFEAIAVGFGVNCFFEIFFLYFKEKNFFVYSNMKG